MSVSSVVLTKMRFSYTGEETHKALCEMGLDSLILDFFEVVFNPADGRDVADVSVSSVNGVFAE